MIDWWLLFCLFTLILIMLFHTIIGYRVNQSPSVHPSGGEKDHDAANSKLGMKRLIGTPKALNQCGQVFFVIWIVAFNVGFFLFCYMKNDKKFHELNKK